MSRPRVYYNEIDDFKCRWLSYLMEYGLIPAGDLDRRPIEEVKPSDVQGYTQCHFFAGIGGWPLALRLAGWPDDRTVWVPARARRSPSPDERRRARLAQANTLSRALEELATSYARDAATHGLPTPATFGRRGGRLSPASVPRRFRRTG